MKSIWRAGRVPRNRAKGSVLFMKLPGANPFVLRGTFAGFVRTAKGKRRMILRTPQGETVGLKAPKALLQEMERAGGLGGELEVTGREKGLRPDGTVRREVVGWRWFGVGQRGCAGCKIRVCAKANCWKQGGQALWQALEAGIREKGLEGVVELKAVRCMGRCKRAPNLEWRGRYLERCKTGEALAVLEQIASEAGGRDS